MGNPWNATMNCEIYLILTWSANCVISSSTAVDQATRFAVADTKLYVVVVTLVTDDNAKLLQQFQWKFKHAFNWNKYLSTATIQVRNQYFDYLIDPTFYGINILLSFIPI